MIIQEMVTFCTEDLQMVELNFGATVNLSNNAFSSLDPAVATSGNNVYVVWYDNTPGSFEIFTGGLQMVELNFGSTENLSNNAGFSARTSCSSIRK